MERIAILGCGGSGKTYLARKLASRLDLPLIHLDAVYYDTDWNPLSQADFTRAQQHLVGARRWVIEGNYASTLPIRLTAADTVIILDMPARACLAAILRRRLRHRGGQHPEAGVYDRITWHFIRYILHYRRTMLPRVMQLSTEHAADADIIVLRGRTQVMRFWLQLPPEGPRTAPGTISATTDVVHDSSFAAVERCVLPDGPAVPVDGAVAPSAA